MILKAWYLHRCWKHLGWRNPKLLHITLKEMEWSSDLTVTSTTFMMLCRPKIHLERTPICLSHIHPLSQLHFSWCGRNHPLMYLSPIRLHLMLGCIPQRFCDAHLVSAVHLHKCTHEQHSLVVSSICSRWHCLALYTYCWEVGIPMGRRLGGEINQELPQYWNSEWQLI